MMPVTGKSYILVLRNQQGNSALVPALVPLNHQCWMWLQGLKNSRSLSQLCNMDNTDLSVLMNQITDWIALGCMNGFSSKAFNHQQHDLN